MASSLPGPRWLLDGGGERRQKKSGRDVVVLAIVAQSMRLRMARESPEFSSVPCDAREGLSGKADNLVSEGCPPGRPLRWGVRRHRRARRNSGPGVREHCSGPPFSGFGAVGQDPMWPARLLRPSLRELPVPRAETGVPCLPNGPANRRASTLQGFSATTLPSFQM